MNLKQVAMELVKAPVAMEPERLHDFLAEHGPKMPRTIRADLGGGEDPVFGRNPPYVNLGGIAVITVDGVLTGGNFFWPGWVIGYGALAAAVRAALADSSVTGIMLRMDSPGGSAVGCPEAADIIAAAAKEKPVVAFAEGMMASAAYWLGSAASQVFASQAAPVGSIGVWSAHVDFTKAYASIGIEVSLIQAGARKVDSSPFRPLDAEARANLQSQVDAIYELFAAAVAKGRGITAEAAKATEARLFIGEAAKPIGLIDGVTSFEALLAQMQDASGRNGSVSMVGAGASTPASGGNEEVQMDPKKKGPEAGADGGDGGSNVVSIEERLKAAEERAAKAEAEAAKANAKAEASAATIAEIKANAKTTLIKQAQLEGKVTGANLKAVEKLAEVMDASELEGYLAELPAQTHARAAGIAESSRRPTPDDVKVAAALGMSAEQMSKFDQVKQVHVDGTVTLRDGSRVSSKEFLGQTGRA